MSSGPSELRRAFQFIDVDASGHISYDEFVSALKERCNLSVEKALLDAVWKSYGVIRGEIDFHVFVENVMSAATFIDASADNNAHAAAAGSGDGDAHDEPNVGHQLLGARGGGQARIGSAVAPSTAASSRSGYSQQQEEQERRRATKGGAAAAAGRRRGGQGGSRRRGPGISEEDAQALLAEAEERAAQRAADAVAGRAGRCVCDDPPIPPYGLQLSLPASCRLT